MRGKVVSGTVLMLLLICMLMATFEAKAVYPPSTVYVVYPYFRSTVLKQYSVRILVDYVENLWHLNITLSFNKNIAEAFSITDGGFLNEPYETTTTINNPQGFVRFEAVESESTIPKTGGFPPYICTVTFNATNAGQGSLELIVDFWDKNGNRILANVQNGLVNQKTTIDYTLAQSFDDYSPYGMPDFDQMQNQWDAYCVPTATANALWWLDSKVETLHNPSPPPPPTISDSFPLVSSYKPSLWDDHDPQNVQPLIGELAYLMDTNGIRTGFYHWGTADLEGGLSQYLQIHGVNPLGDADGSGTVDSNDRAIVEAALGQTPPNWDLRADLNQDNVIDSVDLDIVDAHMGETGIFAITSIENPTYEQINQQFEARNAIILTLELWQERPLTGHAVTVSGLNSTNQEIVINDPYRDAFETGHSTGLMSISHTHPPGEAKYTMHNDARYVSNDAYVVGVDPEGSFLQGYPLAAYDTDTHEMFTAPPGKWRISSAQAIRYIPPDVHDIAVVDITSSKTVVGQTFSTQISATLENQGRYTETFDVTVYANSKVVDTRTGLTLTSGQSTTLVFIWNTTGWTRDSYTINVTATHVPYETDTADNTLAVGTIKVTIPGDIDGDWFVNIQDATLIGLYWLQTVPPAPANVDINDDGIVNIEDATIVGFNWLKPA
jgi:hypothetical protein